MVLKWNEDKKHRCPCCHTVAIDTETPSSWKIYTCCTCACEFARWPRLYLFIDAGTTCSYSGRPDHPKLMICPGDEKEKQWE